MAEIDLRASDVMQGVADVLRGASKAVGNIHNKLYEAQRVQQVNGGLAFMTRADQQYQDQAAQRQYDQTVETIENEFSGATTRSTRQVDFGHASEADIEAAHAKYFESQQKYIMENVSNTDAQKELLYHLSMQSVTSLGKMKQQWHVNRQHAAIADLGKVAEATLADSSLSWEQKVKRVETRVRAVVAAGDMWADDGDRYVATIRQQAQYSDAYNGSVSAMLAAKDLQTGEDWLEKNTPYYASDPDTREKVRSAVEQRWNQVVREENGKMEAGYANLHINAKTVGDVQSALGKLSVDEFWGDSRGDVKYEWEQRFESLLAAMTPAPGGNPDDDTDPNIANEFDAIYTAYRRGENLTFQPRYMPQTGTKLGMGRPVSIRDCEEYLRHNEGVSPDGITPRLPRTFARSNLYKLLEETPTELSHAIDALLSSTVKSKDNPNPLDVTAAYAYAAELREMYSGDRANDQNLGGIVKAWLTGRQVSQAIEGGAALDQRFISGKFKQSTTESYLVDVSKGLLANWRDRMNALEPTQKTAIEQGIQSHAQAMVKSISDWRGTAPTDYAIMDNGEIWLRYQDPKNKDQSAFYRFTPNAKGNGLVLERMKAEGVWEAEPSAATSAKPSVDLEQQILGIGGQIRNKQASIEQLRKTIASYGQQEGMAIETYTATDRINDENLAKTYENDLLRLKKKKAELEAQKAKR